MTTIYSFSAAWFRRVLDFAGWDADILADWANLPREKIENWARGKELPTTTEFDSVAEILALSRCHCCGGLGYVDMADARTIKALARTVPKRDLRKATEADPKPAKPKLPDKPRAVPSRVGAISRRDRILIAREPVGAHYRVGRLVIDQELHLAMLGSTAIEVSPRELCLLEMLCQAAGDWVSAAEIGQIWPNAPRPAHNARTLASILRKKLALLGADSYLEGRSSEGYRLVSPDEREVLQGRQEMSA